MRRPVPGFYDECDGETEELFNASKALFTHNGWLRKGVLPNEPGVYEGRHLWIAEPVDETARYGLHIYGGLPWYGEA